MHTKIIRWVHWSMAFAVLLMILLGYNFGLVKSWLPNSLKKIPFFTHQILGIILFFLAIFRICHSLYYHNYALKKLPLWQRIAAFTTLATLYIILILLPLSGILASWFGRKGVFHCLSDYYQTYITHLMEESHSTLAIVLIFAIILHILGACYHHFILKDNTLISMIRDTKKQ